MRTKEETAEAYKVRAIGQITGQRPGSIEVGPPPIRDTTTTVEGLGLSDLVHKPLDFFKANPANAVFAERKTPQYWQALKRDIREAGVILNPVIAQEDGTLLEGHSRIQIVKELLEEGIDLGKVPTLLVTSHLTAVEAEHRVYLGNLSRFEVDEDIRISLYARIWPDFFLVKGTAGRPMKSDVSPAGSNPGEIADGVGLAIESTVTTSTLDNRATVALLPTTDEDMALKTGVSLRTLKNDKALARDAAALARTEGKESPDPEHVRQAREAKNGKRRLAKKTSSDAVPIKLIEDMLVELDDLATQAETKAEQTGPDAALHTGRMEAFKQTVAMLRDLLNTL
jgi:hypothetical protein